MSNDKFNFKQFEISQDRCAMKVGTDGVLIGAWAPLLQAHNILDIGSGSGLLALMAAQRNSAAHIDAVEIEAAAAAQARENIGRSPWSNRIALHCITIQDFTSTHINSSCQSDGYDFIISNPPFFEETLKPSHKARATARHTDTLPFSDLMRCASQLMTDEGAFALIYPSAAQSSVQTAAAVNRLFCSDLCEIRTVPGKPAKRQMAVYRKKTPEYIFRKDTISIYNAPNEYSPEYKSLTRDFYLNF